MNPALLILLPVILAIFLTGGISIKSPGGEGYGQPVTLSEGALAGIFNSLQINSLVPGSNPTPAPTTPPGVTSTPEPTAPPGASPTKGPTPTKSPTPSPTPTITPFCPGKKVAIDLLIDTSRTMYTEKMRLTKQALREFPKYISNQVLVAIQRFSSPSQLGGPGHSGAVSVLPLVQYSASSYLPAVNNLPDSGDGATHIRDGFILAKSVISGAPSGYERYLIVLSDGMPVDEQPPPYQGDICCGPHETQNPNTPPSISQDIKNSGVKIITIGLDLGSHDRDSSSTSTSTYARSLLQQAQNSGYYEPSSVNDLINIYKNIARSSICNK